MLPWLWGMLGHPLCYPLKGTGCMCSKVQIDGTCDASRPRHRLDHIHSLKVRLAQPHKVRRLLHCCRQCDGLTVSPPYHGHRRWGITHHTTSVVTVVTSPRRASCRTLGADASAVTRFPPLHLLLCRTCTRVRTHIRTRSTTLLPLRRRARPSPW